MPDKKLTDNEIVKALECCASNVAFENCAYCHYKEDWAKGITCLKKLIKDSLDLINRLQAEKQNLEVELQAMRGMVRNAPSADVFEVRHGEWIEERCNHKPHRLNNPEKWVKYKCSECGYSNGRKHSNYCPNCGAKMDGKAEDEQRCIK